MKTFKKSFKNAIIEVGHNIRKRPIWFYEMLFHMMAPETYILLKKKETHGSDKFDCKIQNIYFT